jgi:hypothetical protein
MKDASLDGGTEVIELAIIWTIFAATPSQGRPMLLDKSLTVRFDNAAACEIAIGMIRSRVPPNVELSCSPYLAPARIAHDPDPRTIPEVLR